MRVRCFQNILEHYENYWGTHYGSKIMSLDDQNGVLIVKANINASEIIDFEYSLKKIWNLFGENCIVFEYITSV